MRCKKNYISRHLTLLNLNWQRKTLMLWQRTSWKIMQGLCAILHAQQ